jgi:hypothetical protein
MPNFIRSFVSEVHVEVKNHGFLWHVCFQQVKYKFCSSVHMRVHVSMCWSWMRLNSDLCRVAIYCNCGGQKNWNIRSTHVQLANQTCRMKTCRRKVEYLLDSIINWLHTSNIYICRKQALHRICDCKLNDIKFSFPTAKYTLGIATDFIQCTLIVTNIAYLPLCNNLRNWAQYRYSNRPLLLRIQDNRSKWEISPQLSQVFILLSHVSTQWACIVT